MELEEKLLDTLTNRIGRMSHNESLQTAMALKQMLNLAICDHNGEIRQEYIRAFGALKKFD